MCLILFSYNTHENYRLILGANRDEFYERPTAPLNFWKDSPAILAGRDLRGGGTWMGVTRTGRFAALTNYRDPASQKNGAPSRGALVSDFLRGDMGPAAYLKGIERISHDYNGFNLLVGDMTGLFYYANPMGEIREVRPGIYGLSNRFLNTPWPKVEKGKAGLRQILKKGDIDTDALFDLLGNRSHPPEDLLPDTGVGREWERILSPLFITSPIYGTRSSSVLLISRDRRLWFTERTFVPRSGDLEEEPRTFTFDI